MASPPLPNAVASATERVFATLSSARSRRILHPHGIAFRSSLAVEADVEGVPLLAAGATLSAVVRFSRGLGLPRGRPDFLGVAVRLGEEQELLLASSSSAPIARYVPLPARTFFGTTFSSLLPFRAGDRVVLVGARVEGAANGADDQLAELETAASRAPIEATFASAAVGRRWQPFGRLTVEERLPDDEAAALRFDPWRCAGGLVPWGRINALRAPAYAGSRRGRARSEAGAAGLRSPR